MQYNLVRNGYLSSSGTVSLSLTELEKLKDGNTTSSGISITSSGVLYLDLDMSQRIKVDDIRLYTNDTGHSSNVTFSYRNSSSEGFTDLVTSSGSSYYYTTIADPSAPRYLKVTVSGVDLDLYEFLVYNDDYIVAFGEDGTEYAKYLGNTPINEVSDPTTVAVYNNSDLAMPADAYVSIDPSSATTSGWKYVEIANMYSGPYWSVLDGALIEDNLLTSDYRWGLGEFSSTEVVNHEVRISSGSEGTYTTPILKLDNKYNASFIYIENDGIVSQDGIAIDTIEVRSTDTDPLTLNIFYTPDGSHGEHSRVWEWNPYSGTYSRIIDYDHGSSNRGASRAVAVDRKTGWIAVANWPNNYGTSVVMFDSSFNFDRWIYNSWWYNVQYYYRELDFDNSRGVWCVNHYSRNSDWYGIYHYNKYLNNEGNVQFPSDQCYDMAVELDGADGDGVWYVNSTLNTLVHLDGSASTLQTIYLGTPRGICPTLDNGCWVYDFSTDKFYRYDKNGSLVSTINGDAKIHLRGHRMTHDYNNGFWCRDSQYISHVTENGVRDVGPIYIQNADRVYGCRNGCFVAEHTTDEQYFIGLESGSIEYNKYLYGSSLCYGSAASYNYEDAINFNYDFVPASYDPVWSNLEFETVPKNGFFLPKVRYHQLRITLRTGGDTPALKKVVMTPAIKLENIQPGSYQNLYVRTNIPAGANIDDYDASIRAWWDIQDS